MRPIVFHPFLFALIPILFLFAHNADQVRLTYIVIPMAIVLSLALLLFFLVWIILRDLHKAGLVTTVALFMLLNYGHMFDLLQTPHLANAGLVRHRYVVLLCAAILGSVTYLVIRTGRRLEMFTIFLNLVSVSLMFISLFSIGSNLFRFNTPSSLSHALDVGHRPASRTERARQNLVPDIYYIVLDGYARATVLEEIYDFDNDEFLDYLVDKQFFVASQSRSNYAHTYLSLAATLNMRYINELAPLVGIQSKDRRLAYDLVRNNMVFRVLRSKGYRIVQFDSGWGATDRTSSADVIVDCHWINSFHRVLLRTTLIRPMEKYLKEGLRERTLCIFDTLAEMARAEGPKFVFAHIMPPHPPYLFDAAGGPVSQGKLKMQGNVWKPRDLYLAQLVFINKQVKEVIDKLLVESIIPPIIIIQSDHGPASTFNNWKRPPTEQMLRERMGVLNAFHLPNADSELLYDSISLVNTFRVVFSHFFGEDYPLLDDESYFSSYETPYDFMNVTYVR